MKRTYLLPLNLQMFAEADDDVVEIIDDDEGEVIGDDEHEDSRHDGGRHRAGAGGVELHQALEGDYWKQFLDIQRMNHEKVERVLDELKHKLEDLDRRHQAVPASIRAEIEALLAAQKDEHGTHEDETQKRKSKYSRH